MAIFVFLIVVAQLPTFAQGDVSPPQFLGKPPENTGHLGGGGGHLGGGRGR